MSDQLQLSRMQHFWLLSALLCACVPLWFYLPWWVAVVSLVAIAWRVRRLWSGHGAVNKQLMAVLGIGIAMGTLLTFWPPLGLEPMASLLASAAALKYLELDRQKTAILMIYLCYFVAAIQLIFNQNILFFLVSLFSYSVTLAAQTYVVQGCQTAVLDTEVVI